MTFEMWVLCGYCYGHNWWFFKEHTSSIICTFSNTIGCVQSRCLLIICRFVPLALCQYSTSLDSLGARLWLAACCAVQPLLYTCSHFTEAVYAGFASGYIFALHSRCWRMYCVQLLQFQLQLRSSWDNSDKCKAF